MKNIYLNIFDDAESCSVHLSEDDAAEALANVKERHGSWCGYRYTLRVEDYKVDLCEDQTTGAQEILDLRESDAEEWQAHTRSESRSDIFV